MINACPDNRLDFHLAVQEDLLLLSLCAYGVGISVSMYLYTRIC